MSKQPNQRSFLCPCCHKLSYDFYVVRDEVWAEAGFDREIVHLACFRERLREVRTARAALAGEAGRPIQGLTITDFKEIPGNAAIFVVYSMGLEATFDARTDWKGLGPDK